MLGREVYVTEGKKSVSPVPDKQTTEESGEGGVQVAPAKASVAVAGKKTTKKTLEFKQSDSNSTPPTSTNTGNTNQSQTSSSTQ